MIDPQRLAHALQGTVGLYSGFYSDADKVAELHSEPQVYLSDANAILRPSLLSSMGEYTQAMYFPDYDATRLYKRYEVVKDGDTLYEAVVRGTGNDKTDPNYWQETTPLSAWFSRLERGAIAKLGLELASNPPVKAVLDRQGVFAKEGNIQGVLAKSSRFLFVRIDVNKKDVALRIARFGLQLTGPVTNLPIYLFHSSSAEPLKTFPLTGNNPNRTIWADPNIYVYQQVGGYYLLGFYEDDLPTGVRVIGAERGFNLSGCTSCGGSDYTLAEARSQIVNIQSMYVEGVPLTTGVMDWPQESEKEVKLQSWGMNLILDARCDVTELLLSNNTMLTNMLLLMIACDVLEELKSSTRTNSDVALLRTMANVALYGTQGSKTDFGLASKRDNALNKLKAVMLDLSPSCMVVDAPATEGLEWGSIFED